MKLIFLILGIFGTSAMAADIRVGWQVPWAVQGQLVQVLKHTDILKKKHLNVEFIGRNYGPELNEIALGNQVDVILTADQPAAILFSKNEDWVGVARLMYNRTATYVPVNSPIKMVGDLKGKTIGVPFGAAAQRILMDELKSKNLNPNSDYKLVNLGILEHMPLVAAKKDSPKWDLFDALSGFDPVPAVLEAKGLARVIHVGKVCSMIVMNRKFIEKNKEAAKKLRDAFADAYTYYKGHQAEANKWFSEEAKMKDAGEKALGLAASLEPNLTVAKPNMDFSDEDYRILDEAAEFVKGGTGKKVDMRARVSTDFLR